MRYLIVFLFAMLACAMYMFVRNFAVYDYRSRLAKTVFSASCWDYQWRLSIMESVTYNQMMLRFWKPLRSFYPDKSFLDLSDVRGFAPWDIDATHTRKHK